VLHYNNIYINIKLGLLEVTSTVDIRTNLSLLSNPTFIATTSAILRTDYSLSWSRNSKSFTEPEGQFDLHVHSSPLVDRILSKLSVTDVLTPDRRDIYGIGEFYGNLLSHFGFYLDWPI
jgi:hypothetical protein